MGTIIKPASARPRPRNINFGGCSPSSIEISENNMFGPAPAPDLNDIALRMDMGLIRPSPPDFDLKKEFPVSIEQAKKQAIADLFFAPITVAPLVFGVTSGMVGWANSGPSWLFMAAVGGVLGTIGLVTSRFAFSFESMVKNAYDKIEIAEREKKRQELLALYDKLAEDGDNRDNKALTQLVDFYAQFNSSVRNSPITIAGKTMICEKVDSLFEGCVKTLEHQYNLFQSQNSLVGIARDRVKDQREQELQDVIKSVEQLGIIVSQCLEMSKRNNSETSVPRLRDELEATMQAAKQTEQRMTSVRENDIRV